MDWRTSALLALLLWAEGLRRVPAQALVLRRALAGPWRAGDLAPNQGVRPVAWWPPLTLSLVVPPADAPTADGDALAPSLASRLDRAAPLVRALRGLAGAALLALVVGVPLAARRHGAYGLLAGVAGLLLLTLTCAVVGFVAFRRLGAGRAEAARLGAPLAWPFSAPSAPERVLAYAVAGAPPVAVAAALLPPPDFARWVRPFAYDALTGGPTAGALAARGAAPPDFPAALRSLLGGDALAAVVAARPALPAGVRYCPRCAAEYRPTAGACADCAGVALLGADESLHLAAAEQPPIVRQDTLREDACGCASA